MITGIEYISPNLLPILIVEVDGSKLVPMFQFGKDNKVYKCLKNVLPELKSHRSDWDICFWLTTKLSSVIEAAVPTEQQIEACKCPDDIINLGIRAEEQSTFVTSTPLELLASDEETAFIIFYQNLLDLQIIPIPTKPLILK